jgi:hypothetical protein
MSRSDHLKRLRESAQYGDTPGVLKKDLRALIADYDEMREAFRAAVELLDCSMGVPCRPDLDDVIRAVLAKAGGK